MSTPERRTTKARIDSVTGFNIDKLYEVPGTSISVQIFCDGSIGGGELSVFGRR